MALDSKAITPPVNVVTIMLHKPVGYVSSRVGQGSQTVYDLLPQDFHRLKPVGRLDKDSSGLLLLTNDGQLANKLTHPRYAKDKVYEVRLDRQISVEDLSKLERGVKLNDGISRLEVIGYRFEQEKVHSSESSPASTSHLAPTAITVALSEGRNRQIRRTFENLGYNVVKLHRTKFGKYELGNLAIGTWQFVNSML